MTDDRKRLGGSNEHRIESYRPRVAEINAAEMEHEALSDAALRVRSEEFKQRLANGSDKPRDDRAVRPRRNEQDRHDLARGVRVRSKSASLAMRPPAKGSKG
jgi:hypothetical protein